MKIKSMICTGLTTVKFEKGAPVTDDAGRVVGEVVGCEAKGSGYVEAEMKITDKEMLRKLDNLFIGKNEGESVGGA